MGESLQIFQSVSIFTIQYNCALNVGAKNRLYRNLGNIFMWGMDKAYRFENKFVYSISHTCPFLKHNIYYSAILPVQIRLYNISWMQKNKGGASWIFRHLQRSSCGAQS